MLAMWQALYPDFCHVRVRVGMFVLLLVREMINEECAIIAIMPISFFCGNNHFCLALQCELN